MISHLYPDTKAKPAGAEKPPILPLDWQIPGALLRLDREIQRRLGEHVLQKLSENGVDLLLCSRKQFQKLVGELYSVRNEPVTWQSKQEIYPNTDRPLYVEDGYIYSYFDESLIFRRFLEQQAVHKMALERLTDLLLEYLEKVVCHLERYWGEFQHHYKSRTEGSVVQKDISVEEHRAWEQLKELERDFWQDCVERALEQLQLDLPGSAKLEIGPNEFGPPRYVFEYPLQYVEGRPFWERDLPSNLYYIPLVKEIKHCCNWSVFCDSVLQKSNTVLENCLEAEGLILERDSTEHEYRYFEYPNFPPPVGECAEGPDEMLGIRLRYATAADLAQTETLRESVFVDLSHKIRSFAKKVEKQTRWLQKVFWAFKMRDKTAKDKEVCARLVTTELLNGAQKLEHLHRAGEARLLFELLEKADLALWQQCLLYGGGRRHYQLRWQLKQYLRQLLGLLPDCEKDLGIQLTACYRTTSKRRESYLRLKRVLDDFAAKSLSEF